MTTGLHQPRHDVFGGFQDRTNDKERNQPVGHTSQNGNSSRWEPFWSAQRSNSGMELGSSSLLSPSDVDDCFPRRPSEVPARSSQRQNSGFSSLQQNHLNQPSAARYHNGSVDSTFTSAGQSIYRPSQLDPQARSGHNSISTVNNGQGGRQAMNRPNPFNDALPDGTGFGQANGSWAEDDSMFSPMDSRQNSVSRENKRSVGGPTPPNGLSNGALRSLRGEPNPTPWQNNALNRVSDRSSSLGNGFPVPGAFASQSASASSGQSAFDSDLSSSFNRMNIAGSDSFAAVNRRHNSAFAGSLGLNINTSQAQQHRPSRDMGTWSGHANGARQRPSLNQSTSSLGSRPSLADAFDMRSSIPHDNSDFYPTYTTTDMVRQSSSDSHRSHHLSSRNDNPSGSAPNMTSMNSANGFAMDRSGPYPGRQADSALFQYQYQQWLAAMQMRGQIPAQIPGSMQNPFGIPVSFDMPMNSFNPYMAMPPVNDPRMQSLNQQTSLPEPEFESGTGLRSALLEEFKSNWGGKGPKKYELRDIYDHLVEFSGDREGSHFIQDELPSASSEQKERAFNEIKPNLLPLMKDVFGNYVVQKFFQHGDLVQKKWMVNRMQGRIHELSLSVYGCRVVQTALENVLVEQAAAMMWELKDHISQCIRDENGNHVLQKAIMSIREEDHIRFLIDELLPKIQELSRHKYGCRVVQKMLKYSEPPTQAKVLQEIHACSSLLISDEYGNYVPQHVIEHGPEQDRNRIIAVVMSNLTGYSRQKFASNVVEKCVKFGTDAIRSQMLEKIIAPNERGQGESCLSLVLKDNYGNYVIQSLLDHLNDADYFTLVQMIQPELDNDKRLGHSKQAENVYKKMHRFDERFIYPNLPPPNMNFRARNPGTPTPSLSTTGGTQTPLSVPISFPTEASTLEARGSDDKSSNGMVRIDNS